MSWDARHAVAKARTGNPDTELCRSLTIRAHFSTLLDTVDEAMDIARRRFPGQADALVFPYGGITYPILPAGQG